MAVISFRNGKRKRDCFRGRLPLKCSGMFPLRFFSLFLIGLAPLFGQTNVPAISTAAPATVQVLAPAGHFPDWLKNELGQKLGCPFQVQTYALPEEAQNLLSAPGSHYDLALIPDRVVLPLIQASALRPLPANHGTTPDHVYLSHYFDRDNTYVLPYAWALAVLAYDSRKVHTPPSHWSDLSEPGLINHTYSSDPLLLPALANKEHHPLPSTPPGSPALSDALYQAGTYSSLHAALGQEPDWKYVQPQEGSLIYLYEIALPASGENKALADQAVPLFLDPATTARLDSENFLQVTQPEALPLVPTDVAHNPLIYAPHKIMDLSSFIKK